MIVKNGAFWWNLTGLRPAVRSNRLTSLILMIMMIMMAIMVPIMMVMLLMMMLLLMLVMMMMIMMMMMATGLHPAVRTNRLTTSTASDASIAMFLNHSKCNFNHILRA